MGFIKQVVGDLTGANAQADAMRDSANQQAEATRKAAESAAAASSESAKQTAQQQAALAANSASRSAALSASEDAISKPPENPEVQVDDVAPSGTAKKRREKFGIGSSGSGVNI